MAWQQHPPTHPPRSMNTRQSVLLPSASVSSPSVLSSVAKTGDLWHGQPYYSLLPPRKPGLCTNPRSLTHLDDGFAVAKQIPGLASLLDVIEGAGCLGRRTPEFGILACILEVWQSQQRLCIWGQATTVLHCCMQ